MNVRGEVGRGRRDDDPALRSARSTHNLELVSTTAQ